MTLLTSPLSLITFFICADFLWQLRAHALVIKSNDVTEAFRMGPSGTCGLERCDVAANCVVPEFPPLKYNPKLPDPFTFINGTRVVTKADWLCRRAEIYAQLEHYEVGHKPERPPLVQGKVTPAAITVTAGFNASKSITFSANVTLPTRGRAPYPAIIVLFSGVGNSICLDAQAILDRGIALIMFPNALLGQQDGRQSRGLGLFYDLYGANHTAGAMIAWSYGISRMIDVMEQSGQSIFDIQHIGVTGCSRDGKGTIIAAAFDERVALALPQESGSGGAASWRISDWQGNKTVQTLGEITHENVWFTPSFSQFRWSATLLPFDHHELHGLIAPRALLIIENQSTVWGGNISCWSNSLAGHMIYQALSIDDHSGVTQVGEHPHCSWPGTQESDVEAFITKFLLGGQSNTTILRTTADYVFDKDKWIDWTVPILK